MIKFKYKIPDNLIPLMRSEFLDYYDDYLIGYLPEELTGVLEHCSLYLVCNEQEHSGNVITYHDPIVIVAKKSMRSIRILQHNCEHEGYIMACS